MAEPVSTTSLRLPTGAAREIGIYWMSVEVSDEELGRAERSVDAELLARANRMYRPADRVRTLLAHALLRQVLWQLTQTPPALLAFQRRCTACDSTDHGRPFLLSGPSFSLSHGGDAVAVAVGAAEASVGIDIEADQLPRRWTAIRRHAFTDADWEATMADPGPERTAVWARKEAVVKAMGIGLELPLTRLHLEPAGEQLTAVRVDEGDPAAPPGPWAVAGIHLAEAHQAAVALRGAPDDWTLLPPQRVALVEPPAR